MFDERPICRHLRTYVRRSGGRHGGRKPRSERRSSARNPQPVDELWRKGRRRLSTALWKTGGESACLLGSLATAPCGKKSAGQRSFPGGRRASAARGRHPSRPRRRPQTRGRAARGSRPSASERGRDRPRLGSSATSGSFATSGSSGDSGLVLEQLRGGRPGGFGLGGGRGLELLLGRQLAALGRDDSRSSAVTSVKTSTGDRVAPDPLDRLHARACGGRCGSSAPPRAGRRRSSPSPSRRAIRSGRR